MTVRALPGAAALLLAALVFSSCTDSGPAAAPAPSVTPASPADPVPSASSATSASSTPTVASTLSPTPATFDATKFNAAAFVPPSGNMTCDVNWYDGTASASCEIYERTYADPPRPEGCEFDWTNFIQLHKHASFGCVSDTMSPAADINIEQYGDYDHVAWFALTGNAPLLRNDRELAVLNYGQTVKVREISCTSLRTGVECRNAKTGGAFTISRSKYSLH